MNNLETLEKNLGVNFKNKKLLIQALTHRSFLNETNQPDIESNERLEFLGDTILSFVISEWLFERFPDYFEKRQKFNRGICLAGYNYFHITNFGEITVCGKGPKLNIRDWNIDEIWNSANFWDTRMKTTKCTKPCLNNCFELI